MLLNAAAPHWARSATHFGQLATPFLVDVRGLSVTVWTGPVFTIVFRIAFHQVSNPELC